MLSPIVSSVIFLLLLTCSVVDAGRKLIDLSHPFNNETLKYPASYPFLLLHPKDPNEKGFWLLAEDILSGIHTGTHIDAPRHFGEHSWSIDEIPLERLIVPAAVVNVVRKSQANPDYQVTAADLMDWERTYRKTLNEVVVFMHTGFSRRWPDKKLYLGDAEGDVTKLHFPGFHPDAAAWLLKNRNVYGVGTDALSIDYGPSVTFDVHKMLLPNNIYFLENVNNLHLLPPYGATLMILPLKITGASGSPIRLVATVP